MRPNILDSKWKYTPSAQTDLRKTFARLKREQAADRKAAAEAPKHTVTQLVRGPR